MSTELRRDSGLVLDSVLWCRLQAMRGTGNWSRWVPRGLELSAGEM